MILYQSCQNEFDFEGWEKYPLLDIKFDELN